MKWVRKKSEDNGKQTNTFSKELGITNTFILHYKKLTLTKYFNYVYLDIKYQNTIQDFICQFKLDKCAQVKE